MQFESSFVIAIIGQAESEVIAKVEGRIVYSHRFSVGIQTFADAVIEYFRRDLKLLIGEKTAEAITIAVGSAFPEDKNLSMEVRGRDLHTETPRIVKITETEISRVISKGIETIVSEIKTAIGQIPSKAQTALADYGVTLNGEGAFLRGLDKRIMLETKLPVVITDTAAGR